MAISSATNPKSGNKRDMAKAISAASILTIMQAFPEARNFHGPYNLRCEMATRGRLSPKMGEDWRLGCGLWREKESKRSQKASRGVYPLG
jgi:hypothetical protein